jgi:ABC-type glutathione transport system ATPase component
VSAPPPLLRVEQLVKRYGAAAGRRRLLRASGPAGRPALDGVSLTLGAGETLGIVGETGSGKTTLGHCIAGLIRPTDGEILYEGEPIGSLRLEKRVQTIFQDPHSSLNPARTVGSVLREILRVHRLREPGAVAGRVRELLDVVGLPAAVADRYPRSLSGGQRQRVAIARALAFEPRLIVADEVVSALDVSVQAQILNLLYDLQAESGLALIFISHNLAVVRYLCHDVVVMHEGKIVERGPVERVLTAPEHDYTRMLRSAVLAVDPPSGAPAPDDPEHPRRAGRGQDVR